MSAFPCGATVLPRGLLQAHHGVLHDDDAGDTAENGAGYGDNLECGVRIRAPKHGTVNLHFTQVRATKAQ